MVRRQLDPMIRTDSGHGTNRRIHRGYSVFTAIVCFNRKHIEEFGYGQAEIADDRMRRRMRSPKFRQQDVALDRHGGGGLYGCKRHQASASRHALDRQGRRCTDRPAGQCTPSTLRRSLGAPLRSDEAGRMSLPPRSDVIRLDPGGNPPPLAYRPTRARAEVRVGDNSEVARFQPESSDHMNAQLRRTLRVTCCCRIR